MKKIHLLVALGLVALPVLADGPSHAMKVFPDPKIAAALPPDLRKAWMDEMTAAPKTAQESSVYGDIVRIPYQSFKVYKVHVAPGSPLMVELPEGETANKGIWIDTSWWKAESIPGSNRLVVTAIPAEGIVGKRTFMHVETTPSNLRISFELEAVGEQERVPAVVKLYLDAPDADTAYKRQFTQAVADQTADIQRSTEEVYRRKLEEWKDQAATKFYDLYKWSGDVDVERVISDGVQTRIFSNAPELSSVGFINKDGDKPEVVNFTLQNGVYIINRVLQSGEKFVLTLGKKTTTIKVRG